MLLHSHETHCSTGSDEQTRKSKINLSMKETETKQTQVNHDEQSFFKKN